MGLKAVCPVKGCGYIAFGDTENEVKRDLRYHLMDSHHINHIPDGVKIVEEVEPTK